MLKMPEMKAEILAHIVRAFSYIDFVDDDEIEQIARTLESKTLSNETMDNSHFAAIAKMLRGYKETHDAQA